jgi:hypothetical protein
LLEEEDFSQDRWFTLKFAFIALHSHHCSESSFFVNLFLAQ